MSNPHESPAAPDSQPSPERTRGLQEGLTRMGLDISNPEIQAFIAAAATGQYDLQNPFEQVGDLDLVGKLDALESRGEDTAKVRAEIQRRDFVESPIVGDRYDELTLGVDFLVVSSIVDRNRRGEIVNVHRRGWRRPNGTILRNAEVDIAV